jgi:hypothetical protein
MPSVALPHIISILLAENALLPRTPSIPGHIRAFPFISRLAAKRARSQFSAVWSLTLPTFDTATMPTLSSFALSMAIDAGGSRGEKELGVIICFPDSLELKFPLAVNKVNKENSLACRYAVLTLMPHEP